MVRTPCAIAHDLSAVIGVIRGSADAARARLEPGHAAAADITRIIRSCEEAALHAAELRRLVCTPDDLAELGTEG